jgi:hypothetical protein
MSILNPTPGELLDRLSILRLKIAAFDKKELCTDALEAEKAGIEEMMRDWARGLLEDMVSEETEQLINQSVNALAAVNALLWKAEDDVREASLDEAFKLARLCKHIAAMNDARNEHILKLDTLYGLKVKSDKIYSTTRTFISDLDLGT